MRLPFARNRTSLTPTLSSAWASMTTTPETVLWFRGAIIDTTGARRSLSRQKTDKNPGRLHGLGAGGGTTGGFPVPGGGVSSSPSSFGGGGGGGGGTELSSGALRSSSVYLLFSPKRITYPHTPPVALLARCTLKMEPGRTVSMVKSAGSSPHRT